MGKQKYTVAEPNFERQENWLNSINICYGIPLSYVWNFQVNISRQSKVNIPYFRPQISIHPRSSSKAPESAVSKQPLSLLKNLLQFVN